MLLLSNMSFFVELEPILAKTIKFSLNLASTVVLVWQAFNVTMDNNEHAVLVTNIKCKRLIQNLHM